MLTHPNARPGPRGVPLLGSTPAMHRGMLGFFERCAREYGDIAFFRLGPMRCVLVNRPEWIHALLTAENDRLKKSWDTRELAVALGNGLLTSEGALWARQRKLIQPAFSTERIRGYGAIVAECAERTLGRWRDGHELDLYEQMGRTTLDVVARALFGADVGDQADVIANTLGQFMDRFHASLTGWLPIPLTVPTPGNLRARRAVKRIDAIVLRMVDEHRKSARRPDDLLSWLLEAHDEQGRIDDRQLRDELVTLLLAGHETTAVALSWSLMLLARHPAVEAKLTAELQAVLGDRTPTADDESRLPYTRQVVEEAMRLYPPAWGIGREATERIELDRHVIPKGTQIFLAQWVTHRDARFFADPRRFEPERFGAEARKRIPRYAYYPFGGGPRVCVGARFAMLESVLLLASIMGRFRIELVPEHRVELQPAVTLRPRYGIRARVHARRRKKNTDSSIAH